MEELVTRLGRVRHFRELPVTALRAIVMAGQVRRFPAGSTIFLEGQPCAGMFVLLAGRVHICKPGPPGYEQIMAVINPVIMFNEVAVLDGGPNPTSAVAAKDCLTWHVGYEAFQAIIQRHPQIGLGLLRVLAARNRALLARCEDLSYRSVQARTAKLLLDLSQHGQQPIDRREHPIRDMSAHVGTVPELVSRSLRVLKDEGFILSTRLSITVCQPEALARLAQLDTDPPQKTAT